MLDKPGCEFKFVQQEPGDGSCTVFSFTDEGYELLKDRYHLKEIAFFSNEAVFSTVIAASAQADLLHHLILSRLFDKGVCRLEIDCLVTELVNVVLHLLPGKIPIKELSVNNIRHHLCTIERAKDYLLQHYIEDITLQQLAKHCNVSHFHFTRLFKQFCGYSPFSYLQQVRLTHAETLIRNTDLPMADICFRSGFHRLDYFSTAFAKQYGASPTKYKLGAADRRIIFHVPIPVN